MENHPKIKNFENKKQEKVADDYRENLNIEAEFFDKLDYLINNKLAFVERKIEDDGQVTEVWVKDKDGKLIYYENLDEISKANKNYQEMMKRLINIKNEKNSN
jgi:hypothetical protein